ncbi:MAG: hypothetical protein ABI625_22465 [bacterium]
MSSATRAYALLLRAYPADFRAAFGKEMALLFQDQRRVDGSRGAQFWAEIIWDVVRSAPALRLESMHARWIRTIQPGENVTMKMTMAVLAMLIGAIEAMNATQEVWVRGALNTGWLLLGGTIGIVAGGLLLAAGIAMLRRTPNAAALAQGAAITCLLVFVLTGLVISQMSIFATILGIGFPIALLIFLRFTRGQGTSTPTMA